MTFYHGWTRINTDSENAPTRTRSRHGSKRNSLSVFIRVHPWLRAFALYVVWLAWAAGAQAHHFKGLPHYNYYENYPQVPEEEYLGQAGEYELSLVVYDFQGINREKAEDPDNVRLFLLIFNLLDNRIYQGPLTFEILDREQALISARFESADLENIYSLHQELPDTGKYAMRVTLHAEGDLQCVVPFKLSSQKVHWGRWIGLTLGILVVVAGVGARKARIAMDRKEARQRAAASSPAPAGKESTHA